MIPKKQRIIFIHILLEFLLLNACIFTVWLVKNDIDTFVLSTDTWINIYLEFSFFLNASWAFIILINRESEFYQQGAGFNKLKNILTSTFLFIGLTSFCAVFLKIEYFNRTTFILPIVLFATAHYLIFSLIFEYLHRRRTAAIESHILIVGAGKNKEEIEIFSRNIQQANYQVCGYLADRKQDFTQPLSYFGKVEALDQTLRTNQVDELFLNVSELSTAQIKSTITSADFHGVRVNLIPALSLMVGHNYKAYSVNGLPYLKYRQSPLDQINNYLIKKFFDIVFSGTVLLLLAPFFIIMAILIKLESKGPVFYKPLRKGEGGKIFPCYKFRSMSVCDDPVNGTMSTVKDDPRLTRLGKFMRRFDLDELPQFFNVLKGNMSIVGPRPHRVNLQKDFRKIVNDYMVRHYVKPGITGWAQVNGWRGPTVTDEQKINRIEHDLWYIENWSFVLDIKIIFSTVFGRKTRINAF